MVSDFHKKGNREFPNSNLLFKTVGIIFLAVMILLAVADFIIYQKKEELTAKIEVYQKQISDIKKSSQTLKNEIANSDNTDYLEKIGYEQFGQTKPGETEYMFIKSGNKTETVLPSTKNKSWFGWFSNAWAWLKNRF